MKREKALVKVEPLLSYVDRKSASEKIKVFKQFTNEIYDYFENAKCCNCEWLQDEVCVNSYSPMCSDYPALEMMCNNYSKRFK